MTWVKVDDLITEHEKCVDLSDAAWTLWLHGLLYCSRNLTDGRIPEGMLARLSAVKNPRKAAGELVEAGLWDHHDGAWWVHDYLDHQRSKAQVEAERAAATERQRKARSRRESQRDTSVTHGPVTLLETETEAEAETPASTHALTTRGSNLLEDDISELRVRRIGRHITEDPDETVLREVRLMLHEIPEADDVTIALAVAR